jgi:hypothetical protein
MKYSNLTDVELTYAVEVTNDALVALAKRQRFFAAGDRMPGDSQSRTEQTAFYAIAIEHLRQEFDELLVERARRHHRQINRADFQRTACLQVT